MKCYDGSVWNIKKGYFRMLCEQYEMLTWKSKDCPGAVAWNVK